MPEDPGPSHAKQLCLVAPLLVGTAGDSCCDLCSIGQVDGRHVFFPSSFRLGSSPPLNKHLRCIPGRSARAPSLASPPSRVLRVREVGKEKLGGILVQAKCAAKNIRAQRERLLQFQLQLQLQPNRLGGEGDANAEAARLATEEVVDGLIRVYCEGLEAGARYLTACLAMTAQSGVPPSLPLDFAVISDEQLFGRLLALRLPRRPVTQAQAFARIEAAFYAVNLNLKYCLTRCIEHLGHPKCATDDDDDEFSQESLPGTDDDEYWHDGSEFGLPDPVDAATEDLAKIALSGPGAAADTEPSQDGSQIDLPDADAAAIDDRAKIGLTDPDAVSTDPTQDSSKTGLPAPATGETPQAPIVDMDQARTYLDHACTLADLAVKHVDLAVTAISSCLDPAQIASISAYADSAAYTK